MNIYVIFIYTFILVILKSSNCSDRYPGYSNPDDDNDDDDNNFDVTQSVQPPEQQHPQPQPQYYGPYQPYPLVPYVQYPQPTQPLQPPHVAIPTPIQPIPQPGTGYYGPLQPQPQPHYYPGYQQPQPPPPQPPIQQPYQPPYQYYQYYYPGYYPYQAYGPYQPPAIQPQQPVHIPQPQYQPQPQQPVLYQPTQPPYQPPQQQPILQPQQQPYYPGHRPTPTRDPSQVQKEYGQLPGKLTSAAKYKEKKQKELDFIKFYKKSKKGDMVPMTENDYTKVFSNMFVTKYLFKANLEQLICNADTVYIHNPGKPYCTSLTYNKKSKFFAINLEDGSFLYINKRKGQWRTFAMKVEDYIKLYTHDSQGNDLLLSSEHYYIDIANKGSFKYTFKQGVYCTKIIFNQKLVWEKTDHEPNPNAVSVTSKTNVVLHYDSYVSVYSIVRGEFKGLYIKPIKKVLMNIK